MKFAQENTYSFAARMAQWVVLASKPKAWAKAVPTPPLQRLAVQTWLEDPTNADKLVNALTAGVTSRFHWGGRRQGKRRLGDSGSDHSRAAKPRNKSEVQSAQEIWVQCAVELQNGTASDLAVYAKNVGLVPPAVREALQIKAERKKMPSQGGRVGECMLTVIAVPFCLSSKRRQLLTSTSAASFGRPFVTGALGSQDRHRDTPGAAVCWKHFSNNCTQAGKKGVRFGPAPV